jgi:hypothetical protein
MAQNKRLTRRFGASAVAGRAAVPKKLGGTKTKSIT